MKMSFNLLKKGAIIAAFIIHPITSLAQTDAMQEAFTKSHYYERIKNFPSAITTLKSVYTADSYELNVRLGWLHYNAELYKESMEYYKNAINLKPLGIEARLGFVYPAAALGNMTQVIEQYNKVLEISPLNSATTYKLGVLYFDKKDYKMALNYFEKVVDMYPFSYEGLSKLAWCNFHLGKMDEAQTLFNKLLLLSPGDKTVSESMIIKDESTDSLRNAFAESHYYENNLDYESAIVPLKKVYSPSSYEINVRLGWLSYKAGQVEQALEYYSIAFTLMPEAVEPRMGYIYAATSVKESDLALTQYEKILKVVPMSSQVNYYTGLIFYKKNDYKTALKHFKIVVDLYPFDYDGILMYGWTLFRLGMKEEAKQYFKTALLLVPEDRSATHGLNLIE